MTEAMRFSQFPLKTSILEKLQEIGYEQPSPIQQQSIPTLLDGRDVLGVAQTGTGKTAAFALPILNAVDASNMQPQALILTPTRELAIQVAEAFQTYASGIKGFHVLPIYGGQHIGTQLKLLKRGAQVIVGTPGRVMDHIRRKSLNLSTVGHVVLDEADEMLRMGFIEDVTWILEHARKDRQTALFSATMPRAIQNVAENYLNSPEKITIEAKTTTVSNIDQQAWVVKGVNKLDALTRILEIESFDGIMIFVRTKTATVELAEKLEARGHATAALNGDMNQNLRERTVERLKAGKLDIIVATDVAARGIDVPRISHVINYDIPYDIESYVHRIGRTGRAGRSGKAILFVAPREKRMLYSIERATKQSIPFMQLPSREEIVTHRTAQFKQGILDVLESENLDFFDTLISEFSQENEVSIEDTAKALAFLSQQNQPILLPISDKRESAHKRDSDTSERGERRERDKDRNRDRDRDREKQNRREEKRSKSETREKTRKPKSKENDIAMDTYRLDVGSEHGATPKDIVGAIANEIELDPEYIGQIDITEKSSTVELPCDMPADIFHHLKNVRIRQRKLNLVNESNPNLFDKAKHKKKKTKQKSKGKKRHAV